MLFTRRNIVYSEEPPVTSRAALILLKHDLSDQERAEWTEFRIRFLRASAMICEYCGKTGLTEEPVAGHFYLATLNHIVPVSKGGPVYDPENLKVACFPCNKSKADLSLEEWLSRKL